MEGELMKYYSIDTNELEDDSIKFPIEFLNSINLPCVPQHKLTLKVGCPIILLRNLR